jgi:hypothetical protein
VGRPTGRPGHRCCSRCLSLLPLLLLPLSFCLLVLLFLHTSVPPVPLTSVVVVVVVAFLIFAVALVVVIIIVVAAATKAPPHHKRASCPCPGLVWQQQKRFSRGSRSGGRIGWF